MLVTLLGAAMGLLLLIAAIAFALIDSAMKAEIEPAYPLSNFDPQRRLGELELRLLASSNALHS